MRVGINELFDPHFRRASTVFVVESILPTAAKMAKRELSVGIVGAGIGGVMAAIAIARAGGKVTVLEAAQQLGEIGAGIQMVREGKIKFSLL